MADITTFQNPVYAGIVRKYVEIEAGVYAEVVSAAGGGGSTVTTDTTLTGDGSVGDPLSTQGGAGSPLMYNFSARATNPGAGTNYTSLSSTGAAGAGGYSGFDPTVLANGAIEFAFIAQAGVLSNMMIVLNVAPGAGETAVFSIRVNGADPASGLSVSIGEALKTGADTTHTVTIADGDYIAVKIVLSSGASFAGLSGRVKFTPS